METPPDQSILNAGAVVSMSRVMTTRNNKHTTL